MACQTRRMSTSSLPGKNNVTLSWDDNRTLINGTMQTCRKLMHPQYYIIPWQARHEKTMSSVFHFFLLVMFMTLLSKWVITRFGPHVFTCLQPNFLSSLKDHMLSRLLKLDFDGNKQLFTLEQQNELCILNINHIIELKTVTIHT